MTDHATPSANHGQAERLCKPATRRFGGAKLAQCLSSSATSHATSLATPLPSATRAVVIPNKASLRPGLD